jgi:hypothetical protein
MSKDILVEVWLTEGESASKASAQVTLTTELGELTLCRLKVVHQDGKDPWVAYPTIDYKDRETGDYRHLDTIKPGVRLKKAISVAVLIKYAELGVESR